MDGPPGSFTLTEARRPGFGGINDSDRILRTQSKAKVNMSGYKTEPGQQRPRRGGTTRPPAIWASALASSLPQPQQMQQPKQKAAVQWRSPQHGHADPGTSTVTGDTDASNGSASDVEVANGTNIDFASTAEQQLKWQLVWCHERCNKHEWDSFRNAMNGAAQGVGSTLTCLKKATTFAKWLGNPDRQPFVLLTNWREVKPCFQYAAAQQDPTCWPALTLVLCELPKHVERATAWAQELPAHVGVVRVCTDIGLPEVQAGGGGGRACAPGALRHAKRSSPPHQAARRGGGRAPAPAAPGGPTGARRGAGRPHPGAALLPVGADELPVGRHPLANVLHLHQPQAAGALALERDAGQLQRVVGQGRQQPDQQTRVAPARGPWRHRSPPPKRGP